MDNSIKNLEVDLQNAARSSTDPDDMFAESMGQFSKGTYKHFKKKGRNPDFYFGLQTDWIIYHKTEIYTVKTAFL